MRDWLAGRKTYLTVAAALIALLIAWVSGEVTTFEAMQSAVAAVIALFLRSGSKADAVAVLERRTPN